MPPIFSITLFFISSPKMEIITIDSEGAPSPPAAMCLSRKSLKWWLSRFPWQYGLHPNLQTGIVAGIWNKEGAWYMVCPWLAIVYFCGSMPHWRKVWATIWPCSRPMCACSWTRSSISPCFTENLSHFFSEVFGIEQCYKMLKSEFCFLPLPRQCTRRG